MTGQDKVPYEARKVNVAGGHLDVRVYGRGDLVVFLHGWTLNKDMWRPQVSALADMFKLALIDRRGFGRSSAPPSLSAELADLDALLDSMNVQRAHFVGMSQGGRIALRYANANPGRVKSLTLQGAPLDGFIPESQTGEAIDLPHYTTLARRGMLHELRTDWLSHPLTQTDDPDLARQIAEIVSAYDAKDLTAIDSPDPVSAKAMDLAGMSVPVMIITGSEDVSACRIAAEKMHSEIPGSKHHFIDGAGHLCSLSHAAEYNRLLKNFLLHNRSNRTE